MLRIKDDETETPQVNWENKTANCICTVCATEKTDFPIHAVMRFDGSSFIFMSATYDCGCEYTTVYPLHADHPTARILGQLAGFIPLE